MPPRLRKAVLTTHVTTSVGWLGAVLAYIALDVTAVVSTDVERVRAAYLAMDVTISYAIVPLALASVFVGIVNALGTSWGLFRHYWVLVKLLLTLVATTVLLLETQTIRSLAEAAASGVEPRDLPGSLPHSVGGVVVLFLITALSIYKPRGLTRYGWRKQQEQRRSQPEQPMTPVA
ncbi:hypothetical protein [Blastococcus brunescens]|uniref:DUF2269 domain-containing protein n=1 Tax=Blastococcus brunescens TaxID=1564165 RepID=A0ABZ1B4F8_9ACTN|nr:hypothetical protein [Blastococcus sp. BMG 8361]WRL65675.1 hypothetical protein U6N30_08890 [Blastococcus sp. BMG 8361]